MLGYIQDYIVTSTIFRRVKRIKMKYLLLISLLSICSCSNLGNLNSAAKCYIACLDSGAPNYRYLKNTCYCTNHMMAIKLYTDEEK